MGRKGLCVSSRFYRDSFLRTVQSCISSLNSLPITIRERAPLRCKFLSVTLYTPVCCTLRSSLLRPSSDRRRRNNDTLELYREFRDSEAKVQTFYFVPSSLSYESSSATFLLSLMNRLTVSDTSTNTNPDTDSDEKYRAPPG